MYVQKWESLKVDLRLLNLRLLDLQGSNHFGYGSSQKNYQDFLNETIETDFNFEETSEETVLGLLNKFKNKNTKGHDQISNKLLKCVKNEIAKPLTFIINQTLRTGCYPDKLKIARLRPLYKKGDKQGI